MRMTKFDGSKIDINVSMQKLGWASEHILAVHALTDCDTVSYPFNKGNVKGLSIIQKQTNLHLKVFGGPEADVNDVVNAGMEFLCLLYGDSAMSVIELRYPIFSNKKNTPAIKTLPLPRQILQFGIIFSELIYSVCCGKQPIVYIH